MFVEVAKEFLEVVAGRAEPSCTLAEGVGVMELIEAVRSSSKDGRAVVISGAKS
jgi:predicted dehydrogenase